MVKTGIVFILAYWSVVIAGVVGYIMNVFSLVHLITAGASITSGLFIGRVLGVFVAPLGAILGYF